MLSRTKWSQLFLALTLGILFSSSIYVFGGDSLTLYTPYTNISVPPGESVDYSIDVINDGKTKRNVDIIVFRNPQKLELLPKIRWVTIKQISILPKERKTLSLKVDIPFKVEKGNYRFRVIAAGYNALPLVINVSKQGTYQTEFSTQQSNMQGHSQSTFTFTADLKNRTAEKQLYSLVANTAPGWNVVFKANYKQVTSVDIEANNTQNITIDINPPSNVEAGSYKILVKAATSNTAANLSLEVVITGSYKMDLTTPTGLLSYKITAGDKRRIELVVKNTGSSELNGVELSASSPASWEVTFEPKKIEKLVPGAETSVFAEIKAAKKALPGDYVVNIDAKIPELSAKTTFRMSVETPMLYGWVGVFIIIIAIGAVYYLFRKFGRR